MKREVRATVAAAGDIAAAHDWYERRRPGLGAAFHQELRVAVTLLEEFGEAGPVVHGNLRRVLLRRFPFALYYQVATDVIVLHGCLHQHSDRSRHRR